MDKKQLQITLYGYDIFNLNRATKEVSEFLVTKKVTFSGPWPPKTKKTSRTILTSPHKYKKAQQQFSRHVHRRIISIPHLNSSINSKDWAALMERLPHTIGLRFSFPF